MLVGWLCSRRACLTLYCPVVSLGAFGSACAARTHAKQGCMLNGVRIPVHGITVFQRSVVDSKFYAKDVIPFLSRSVPRNLLTCKTASFLKDAGASWNSAFSSRSDTILSEVKRACREIAHGACLYVYGSHALEATLPGISDIDVFVEVASKSAKDFLGEIADFIQVSLVPVRTILLAAIFLSHSFQHLRLTTETPPKGQNSSP